MPTGRDLFKLDFDEPSEKMQRQIVEAARQMNTMKIKRIKRGSQFGNSSTLDDLTKKSGDYMTNSQ